MKKEELENQLLLFIIGYYDLKMSKFQSIVQKMKMKISVV